MNFPEFMIFIDFFSLGNYYIHFYTTKNLKVDRYIFYREFLEVNFILKEDQPIDATSKKIKVHIRSGKNVIEITCNALLKKQQYIYFLLVQTKLFILFYSEFILFIRTFYVILFVCLFSK